MTSTSEQSSTDPRPMAGIYGGGSFYGDSQGAPPSEWEPRMQEVMGQLKASGFSTAIFYQLGVVATPPKKEEADPDWQGFFWSGDLYMTHHLVTSNTADGSSKYVGPQYWPTQIAGLKKKPSSVDRILFCLGSGWGDLNGEKAYIRNMGSFKAGEWVPGERLYNNFKALKEGIPEIDGIDIDYEARYTENNTKVIAGFVSMLKSIGYKEATFCPALPGDLGFWKDCHQLAERLAPGFVTGINLQCYNGQGNQQQVKGYGDAFGTDFIYPILACYGNTFGGVTLCPDGFKDFFAESGLTLNGGSGYLYDQIQEMMGIQEWVDPKACPQAPMDAKAYASAIIEGVQPG